MGKRTSYTPGTFNWVELATTDPNGAKAFYGALFGWEPADMPMGEGMVYTMLQIDGDDVAALYELDGERRAQSVPPHWFNYVSVADADATAARVKELGGAVLAGPFDVFNAGRMAIIQDPTGATFAAWQPKEHIGAVRVNETGSLTWNELSTRDVEAAMAFYRDLFGWELEPAEQDGRLAYVTIKNAGRVNGGMMPMDERHGDAPPHWLPYFVVPSADDAVARIKELGGAVLAGPLDPMPDSRIAVARDPQGAVFAVFSGPTDD